MGIKNQVKPVMLTIQSRLQQKPFNVFPGEVRSGKGEPVDWVEEELLACLLTPYGQPEALVI